MSRTQPTTVEPDRAPSSGAATSPGFAAVGADAPIIICYDGSPDAGRTVDVAGLMFPGRPAVVLYVRSPVAAERIHTTSVRDIRQELIEEVHVAARRDATAIAEEGTQRARRAGLGARPRTIEETGEIADAIERVAAQESAVAVIIGRGHGRHRESVLDGLLRTTTCDGGTALVIV
jgi:nucleotide-binding universal stress UspA family protein